MPRLKLDLPESYRFACDIPLRITDMNYGNHLGNDVVLAIAHEARVQFLASLGYTEMNVEGEGLIMTDALVIFRSEGFYGESLSVKIATGPPEGARFDILYLVESRQTGREIARVKTGMACFDYTTRKTKAIPTAFAQILDQS